MKRGIALLMMLALCASASAATYTVSPDGTGDYPTIQAAIDASVSGDIVELTDGIFRGLGNADLSFVGRLITLRSQSDDPQACIIDCQGGPDNVVRGFTFVSGEGPEAVVRGITLANGYACGT